MTANACTLEQACTALWSATLALMTAYMHQSAPAHRLLLARRIADNFDTLARQESFAPASGQSFARLHARWHGTAEALARAAQSEGGTGLLQRLWPLRQQDL